MGRMYTYHSTTCLQACDALYRRLITNLLEPKVGRLSAALAMLQRFGSREQIVIQSDFATHLDICKMHLHTFVWTTWPRYTGC